MMNTPKFQRTVVRLWISTASLASFLFGWAILAQSPRPSQNASPASAAPSSPALVLPPVPTLDPALLQGAPTSSVSPLMSPFLPQRGLVFSTGGS
jgi:hypothetical protein